MKCERCQQNEATVLISQIMNGQKSERRLCPSCAREEGLDGQFQSQFGPLLSGGLFGGSIFNPTGGIPAFGGAAGGTSRELVCPRCGTTFEAFRKSGLFGCSQCYETFREKLDPVLRRVQGGTRHIGRQVCRSEESREQMVLRTRLADLRKSLADAVTREAYEEAARLRDEVHALESRICDLSSGGKPEGSGGKPENGIGKGASA